MLYLNLLYATVLTVLRDRLTGLRREGERGAGGNTLEVLLLAVGGVVVAGIVVAVVATTINNRTAELNPSGSIPTR
jgi:hypothetical protein